MEKSQVTEHQIIAILDEATTGAGNEGPCPIEDQSTAFITALSRSASIRFRCPHDHVAIPLCWKRKKAWAWAGAAALELAS